MTRAEKIREIVSNNPAFEQAIEILIRMLSLDRLEASEPEDYAAVKAMVTEILEKKAYMAFQMHIEEEEDLDMLHAFFSSPACKIYFNAMDEFGQVLEPSELCRSLLQNDDLPETARTIITIHALSKVLGYAGVRAVNEDGEEVSSETIIEDIAKKMTGSSCDCTGEDKECDCDEEGECACKEKKAPDGSLLN